MSNSNQFDRLFKLWATVAKLVVDGKRSATMVADALQAIVNETIPKTLSLTEMIALGKYDWVNQDITEANFPMAEDFTFGTETKLFHFDRDISSENAIKEMERAGYKPVTIWDLLDYGAKNSEMQRKFPIVALGSPAQFGGSRNVAYLCGSDTKRSLRLCWSDDGWRGYCRFLAVRN